MRRLPFEHDDLYEREDESQRQSWQRLGDVHRLPSQRNDLSREHDEEFIEPLGYRDGLFSVRVPPAARQHRVDLHALELTEAQETNMHRITHAAFGAIFACASLVSPSALATVIDEMVIERHDSTERVRLRLTGPVHYIRDYVSTKGEIVNVYLQALAPLAPGEGPFPDEVKYSPGHARIPPFTVRVSLDPRCEPVPNPVCVLIQFERPVRCRVRLGEDRRSLLLDFASEEEGRSPSSGKER